MGGRTMERRFTYPWAVMLVVLRVCGAGAQPTVFIESQQAVFSGYRMAFGMVGGAAAGDYDDDGDIDLFVANGRGNASQLLRNSGAGVFEDVSAASGLGQVHNDRGGLWLDYDGDRDLDLVVLADNHRLDVPSESSNLRLYRNTGGRFDDVTDGSGLQGLLQDPAEQPWGFLTHGSGLMASDFNGDGAIDLYVTFWRGRNYLFMNNADGTFTDASAASGIQALLPYWQPVAHDFDGDGDPDIMQAVDFTTNRFFLNNGDGTFTDIAPALGVDNAWNDMGVALGDPDNDGDFDIFITNVHDQFLEQSDYQNRYNVYFRNDSVGSALSFRSYARLAGIDRGDWGWGCTFADLDHDGWQDLAQTNGFDVASIRGFSTDRTRIFHNSGDGTFTDVAAAVGCDDDRIGACFIAFDAERDGDLDLFQTCMPGPAALRTNGLETTASADNGWLIVRPRRVTPGVSGHENHFAIGAVVRVSVATPLGTVVHSRLITAGTSMLGQEPSEAHFGLGPGVERVEDVRVLWPGGGVTKLPALDAGRVITVVDSMSPSADLDGDGRVDVEDVYLANQTAFDLTGDLIYDRGDIDAVEALVRIEP